MTAHSEDSAKILMRSVEPLRGQATKNRISGSLPGECCRSILVLDRFGVEDAIRFGLLRLALAKSEGLLGEAGRSGDFNL